MLFVIKRDVYPKLLEHVENPEITMLVGCRQAGKTTLMELLQTKLAAKGKETVSFNLEREEDGYYFKNQLGLVDRLKLVFGGEKGYVFIDEIQRLENAGLFLKGIYDRKLPYKLVVTGSGSLELKEKIQESLAGRKRMFEIATLSLEEFVNYKTNYQYEGRLAEFFAVDKMVAGNLLKEYLVWGGYPRVVLAQKETEKTATIEDIYRSYLEKDIEKLLGVIKEEEFTKLVMVLADQVGKVANISEISSILGINRETVKKYLWFLKKTYVVGEVRPFYVNLRKELTKRAVYYFGDLGLRNYILGRLNVRNLEIEGGFLFQNLIYLLIKKNIYLGAGKINYWRTIGGAEIDFVINSGADIWPIEVRYADLKEVRVSRSMRSFLDAYGPKKMTIVNLSLNKGERAGKTEIEAVPMMKLR